MQQQLRRLWTAGLTVLAALALLGSAQTTCQRQQRSQTEALGTGDTMPTESPPQGWTVNTGTWGTDVDREETLSETAGYVIHLKSTSVQTEIESDFIGIASATRYFTGMLVRADRVLTDDKITLFLREYDSDKELIGTTTLHNAALAAANTWEWIGGHDADSDINTITNANTRYVKIAVRKPGRLFNAYVDTALLDRSQPSWAITNSSPTPPGQTIPAATWTPVTLDANIQSAGGVNTSVFPMRCGVSATGVVTGHVPGAYTITANSGLESLSDGVQVWLRLKVVSGTGIVIRYRYGAIGTSSAAGSTVLTNVSVTNEVLEPNDTVTLEIWHNDSVPRQVVEIGNVQHVYTYMTGDRNGRL